MEAMKTVAIIGGGAAGLMAASAAAGPSLGEHAQKAARVLLFEKNSYLGAKVIISGGGRCNVTTGIFDVRELLKNYPRGAQFLMSAMFRFPPEKVMEWFEAHGVPLKIEADLRVFPKSDNGKDIVGALERDLRAKGVEIVCNASVVDITKKEEKFQLKLKNGTAYDADVVVLTTGGNAYRQTGSTGDGYAFAKALGHTITPLAASLSSFIVAEPWCKEVAGVSFEKAAFTLAPSKLSAPVPSRTGPFLFTHAGVSGPAIFALSAYSAYAPCSKDAPLELSINLFPDDSREGMEARIDNLIHAHPKKHLANFLDLLLPKSLCAVFAQLLGIPEALTAAHFSKEHRVRIIALLQALTLHVVGRGAGEEFVTAGGVATDEVNTNTMESKKCSGLYFAGELLDIDGFTGGFNLQASWATGRLAGEHIAGH